MRTIWKRKVRENSKEKFIGIPRAIAFDFPKEVFLVLDDDGILLILTPEQAEELGILPPVKNSKEVTAP